jgi:hypothetical protein
MAAMRTLIADDEKRPGFTQVPGLERIEAAGGKSAEEGLAYALIFFGGAFLGE